MDPEGNTYERAAIEKWVRRHGTCPLTRKPLTLDQLKPNRVLEDLMANLEITDDEQEEEEVRPFQVFVKDLNGKSQVIETNPKNTVLCFKEQVARKTGVPADVQRLLFGGKQLDDDEAPLEKYRVQDCCTVQLVLRLLGGGWANT